MLTTGLCPPTHRGPPGQGRLQCGLALGKAIRGSLPCEGPAERPCCLLGRRLGRSFFPPPMTPNPGAPPNPFAYPKGVAPVKPVPPHGASLDCNSSVEGSRVGQLPFPYPPLGSWAPLPVWAQLAQPRGCPGPLENTWSHWAVMAHAMGPPSPLVQPSCLHSYPPFFPTLFCPRASRTQWSPGGPFLDKAPSLWGEASLHLTEGICPFIPRPRTNSPLGCVRLPPQIVKASCSVSCMRTGGPQSTQERKVCVRHA